MYLWVFVFYRTEERPFCKKVSVIIYIYIYIWCLNIYLSIYIYIHAYIVSIYIYIYIYICICTVSLSLSLSIYIYIYIYKYIYKLHVSHIFFYVNIYYLIQRISGCCKSHKKCDQIYYIIQWETNLFPL